jgi:hypothetical protein
MARKPPALARELLRNFPKRRGRSKRRRRRGGEGNGIEGVALEQSANGSAPHLGPANADGAARVLDSSDAHGGSREAANGETSTGETTNGERRPAQRRSRRRVSSADGRSAATADTAGSDGGERDRSPSRAGERDPAGLAGEPALD